MDAARAVAVPGELLVTAAPIANFSPGALLPPPGRHRCVYISVYQIGSLCILYNTV